MHGFGIARRIEQISRGVFKVNPGSLLTALQRLERAGWLDAEWRQTENARRAKFYRSPAAAGSSWRSRPRTGPAGSRPSRGCSRPRASVCLWRQVARGLRGARSSVRDRPGDRRRGGALPRPGHRGAHRAAASRRTRRAGPPGWSWATSPPSASRCAATAGRTLIDDAARRPALRRAAGCARSPASPRSPWSRWRSASAPPPRSSAPSNPILFEPLPYPRCRPDRRRSGTRHPTASRLDDHVRHLSRDRGAARSFEALAVMKPWQPTLTGPAEPERLDGQRVSA